MYKKFQRGLIPKAIAWSMALVLILQPLGLSATGCDCGDTSTTATESTCCESEIGCCGRNSPEKSCCSALSLKPGRCCDSVPIPNSLCKCGNDCQCAVEIPDAPAPAPLPVESSLDQVTVFVAVFSFPADRWSDDEQHLTCARDQSDCDVRTAQQMCTLLSRFNC